MNKQSKSGIEWTDYTLNPIGGCLHGCRWHMTKENDMFGSQESDTAICYAEALANSGRFRKSYPKGFEHIYWRPHLLKSPAKVKEPSKVFVGSMSDNFGVGVKDEWIEDVFDMCKQSPHHVFQMLTKNTPRLLKFNFPSNVWVGISSSPDILMGKEMDSNRKKRYMKRAMEVLSNIDVPVRWISFEPLNEDYSSILKAHPNVIQWAVIGAASNGRKYYPPLQADYEATLAELDKQGIPVFFKGNMNSLRDAAMDWREEFPRE